MKLGKFREFWKKFPFFWINSRNFQKNSRNFRKNSRIFFEKLKVSPNWVGDSFGKTSKKSLLCDQKTEKKLLEYQVGNLYISYLFKLLRDKTRAWWLSVFCLVFGQNNQDVALSLDRQLLGTVVLHVKLNLKKKSSQDVLYLDQTF